MFPRGEIVATEIFVSLPVKSVGKSVEFFGKLGFTFDAQLTDETAACMIMGQDIFVMLVTEDEPKAFAPRKMYDGARSTQPHRAMS